MSLKQAFFKYKLHHISFWIVFGSVWYYLRYQDYRTTGQAVLVTLVKTADLALMVYIAGYILAQKLLYKRKYGWFALVFFLMVVTSSLSKMYLLGLITNNPGLYNWSASLKVRIYDNVIPHFFLVIAGLAIKLLVDYNRMQKRLLEVAKEKAETELSFLKSQMNPHFLFNSLNAVYFLIDKDNKEARQALHKFSDMLRYQLYEVKDEKIPIEKEIGYLKDYIALQQLRNENCEVQLMLDEGVKSFYIEPLLLIPFVENSFKHLSHFSNGRNNEIRIDLSKPNGEMNFNVRNTTEGKQVHELSGNGGIGLANVKRRLELLYPQKHVLKISENNGGFNVHLKIKIDN